jgi:hypothetical protein
MSSLLSASTNGVSTVVVEKAVLTEAIDLTSTPPVIDLTKTAPTSPKRKSDQVEQTLVVDGPPYTQADPKEKSARTGDLDELVKWTTTKRALDELKMALECIQALKSGNKELRLQCICELSKTIVTLSRV